MSSKIDKTYSRLKELLDKAEIDLLGLTEAPNTNRVVLMNSLRLIKLEEAHSRSTEAIEEITKILYADSKDSLVSTAQSNIDILNKVINDQTTTYKKLLELVG